jgi:hypothetical protein
MIEVIEVPTERTCAHCGKPVGVYGKAYGVTDTGEPRYYCNDECMLADFWKRTRCRNAGGTATRLDEEELVEQETCNCGACEWNASIQRWVLACPLLWVLDCDEHGVAYCGERCKCSLYVVDGTPMVGPPKEANDAG